MDGKCTALGISIEKAEFNYYIKFWKVLHRFQISGWPPGYDEQ